MRGADVNETGILLFDEAVRRYILDVGRGAFWVLDIDTPARSMLGTRITVTGKRYGFNQIDVTHISAA